MRNGVPVFCVSVLIPLLSLLGPSTSTAANLDTKASTKSFRDFTDDFVAGEIVVMFRDDTGAHARDWLGKGFASATGKAAASSLDDLARTHSVRKLRRVFRGLEDGRGNLRITARDRAIAQRGRHVRRGARLGSIDQIPRLENVFVIELGPDADVRRAASDFSRDPRVVYAHPNFIYHLQVDPLPTANFLPDDPFISGDGINWSEGAFGQSFPDLYGHRNIQAIEAWNVFDTDNSGAFEPAETRPGEGVVVAVIDSGLDVVHPDGVSVWTNSAEIINGLDDDLNGYVDDINGWDFVDDDDTPQDPNGHGTHVAGTIGAAPDNTTGLIGVAPWVEIMPLRGLGATGIGSVVGLAEAVDYAVAMGADVLSNSWGGFGNDPTIAAAFANAYSQGVLAIAAAGNSNGDATMFTPANIDTVVSVAAVNEADEKAYFSNSGYAIDISAPGVSTLSLSANAGSNQIVNQYPSTAVGTHYMVIGGTSMACPHVAGAAAVLISQFPGENLDEIRGRLRGGADSIDVENPDHIGRLGAGRLNLLGSLNAIPAPDLSFDFVATTGFTTGSFSGAIVVSLRNTWLGATDVQGVLTTSNPLVTIQSDTADFGDIPIGTTASNDLTPFEIVFDPSSTTGMQVVFELDITSTGYQITLEFTASRAIFENVSQAAQLPSGVFIPYHVVMQDYTGDGNADVSLTDGLAGNTLYASQGDGTFAVSRSDLTVLGNHRVLMFDLDSDGDGDVLLSQANGTNTLLRNDAGTFTDITAGSGIPEASFVVLSAMDFEGDGDIDIMAGGWNAAAPEGGLRNTWVLRNNGDETFTDIFASSGLYKFTFGNFHKLDTIDYDNDGDIDLVTTGSDPTGTRSLAIHRNDGSGFFTDVTDLAFPDPLPAASDALAVALASGDYDNDGDMDLFVSRGNVDEALLLSALYRNNGDGTFTDVITSTGELGNTNIRGVYWGTEFFDFDNDTDLDLYIVRDSVLPKENFIDTDSHTLFENNGDGTFSIVNDIAFATSVRPNIGTAAIGDFDNDGLLDIYAPASSFGGNALSEGGLLHNGGVNVNNWLHVNLEGVISNRDAYGARIIVTTGATSQMRDVYTSAVDVTTAHFGLGEATLIDSIEVRWPSGIVQTLDDVAVNQYLAIQECSDGDGDGVCDSDDNCAVDANPDQNDVDGDGAGDICDPDADGDGHANSVDNCVLFANPGQIDTDADACGNVCDADYDQNGLIDFGDFGTFMGELFGSYDTLGDHTEPIEGPVGFGDFGRLTAMFQRAPGPSGIATDPAVCSGWSGI